MTNSTTKPSATFWVISIVALLWNLMGVFAYLSQAYITPEAIALLPEPEQAYYNNVPAWVTGAFALAVFSGTFGAIALILRKKWAVLLFMVSLIAVMVQSIYTFLIQTYIQLSANQMIMPILVIVIAVFLVWYSNKKSKNEIIT
jgi:hypothetical protein